MSALEGLDDDHASAAAGAWSCWGRWFGSLAVFPVISFGRGLGDGHVEEFTGAGDVADTAAVCGQPIVSDAVEAARQYVNEEASDELVGGERHGFVSLAPFGAVILPFEGDIGAIEGDQPAV